LRRMSRDPHERMAVLDLLELLPREDAERIVERLLMHDPSGSGSVAALTPPSMGTTAWARGSNSRESS